MVLVRAWLGVLLITIAAGCSFDPAALSPGALSDSGITAVDATATVARDAGTSRDAHGGGMDGGVVHNALCDSTDLNLAACYPFEPPATPGSVPDGSRYGNDGRASNVLYTAGHDGMAISLGTGSRVSVEDDDSLDPTTALTLEMWVKPSSFPDSSAAAKVSLLDKNGQYGMFVGQGGVVGCATSAGTVTGGVILSKTAFTHVACVFDPTAVPAGSMTLYQGGVPIATNLLVKSTLMTGSDPLTIGAACPGNSCGQTFQGLLDDLRIYRNARTGGQICTDSGLCP